MSYRYKLQIYISPSYMSICPLTKGVATNREVKPPAAMTHERCGMVMNDEEWKQPPSQGVCRYNACVCVCVCLLEGSWCTTRSTCKGRGEVCLDSSTTYCWREPGPWRVPYLFDFWTFIPKEEIKIPRFTYRPYLVISIRWSRLCIFYSFWWSETENKGRVVPQSY